LIPKAIDGRIKPSELSTVDQNDNILGEDNAKNSNGTMNHTKGWGENGATTKLINIATTIDEPTTTRADVDG
jgi:hypothetical protein